METTLQGRTTESYRRIGRITGLVLVAVVLAVALLLFDWSGHTRIHPPVDAYRGLGTWVDIYDARAWANPDAAVADMASHGVGTLYLQTGNSSAKNAVFDPPAQEAFIRAAHAHHMKVVAWYLPSLENVQSDFDRVSQAIKLKTSDGQHFDSFALDIESTNVTPEKDRNRALDVLSRKIRKLAGPSYPLGAIIPSPVGIAKQAGNWDTFPYEAVAKTYDVFVPMGYYTFHGRGAAAASADALGNVRILREQPGCANVPIHLIGGLAEKSTTAEVRAFANATQKSGCIGASLYSWPGTTKADWKALQVVRPASSTAP